MLDKPVCIYFYLLAGFLYLIITNSFSYFPESSSEICQIPKTPTQTVFMSIFSLLICDKSTFLQKKVPNIFTVCQNALIRPVKIMLPEPAITTVIAACGIVNYNCDCRVRYCNKIQNHQKLVEVDLNYNCDCRVRYCNFTRTIGYQIWYELQL